MRKTLLKILTTAVLFLVTFLTGFFMPFSAFDNALTDHLYSRKTTPLQDVLIVRIDEETLTAFGKFETWSREKTALALNELFKDPTASPKVVGVDIQFQGESNDTTDQLLVDAVKDRPIVVAGNVVFKGVATETEHGIVYNPHGISLVEQPFPALASVVKCGFSNAFLGTDNVSRYYRTSVSFEGTKHNSFAYEIASLYSPVSIPKADEDGLFRFFYTSNRYPSISLKTLLEGKIPSSEFKDKIVLIGAYASGMQDQYIPTADMGSTMYGVEIQANVVEAYLNSKTALPASSLLYALILGLIVTLLFVVSDYLPLALAIALPVVSAGGFIGAGVLIANGGILIPQLYSIVYSLLLIAYSIVKKYLSEALKRRKLAETFGKYMEPRLVSQMLKGENTVSLGGRKKDVSVLFVDIRGFTSMSESLPPEEVVGILNEYLGLVTDCIFKHGGMLDKFIGDAAMAVFNAPFDQDDYTYESVAAAYDIAMGSQKLSQKLMDEFGRTISYGIGVNCGEAVIGNVGCDFRMDYTAIGDTVNTAARLEANAGKGEIFLSPAVVERIRERIETKEIGSIKFKGKSEPMPVHLLIGLKENAQ